MSNPIKSITVRAALVVLLIFETGIFGNGQTPENQTSAEVTDMISSAKKLLRKQDQGKANQDEGKASKDESEAEQAENELRKAELLAAAGSGEEKEIRRLLDLILTRRAVTLLSKAKQDIQKNDYIKAKEKAETALQIAPTGSQASTAADSLLQQIGLVAKHRTLLAESQKL